MGTHQTDTDDVGAPRDLETQDVPEDDGVLQPEDSLETDDLSADPLDTEAEARQGETLEQRLAQEEPEIPPVAPDAPSAPRSGRLVSADEGAHPVDESEPRQFAREAGVDGGAASAEEAAVHEVPQDEVVLPDDPAPGD